MCFGSVGNLQLVEALCGRALSVRRPKCIRIAVLLSQIGDAFAAQMRIEMKKNGLLVERVERMWFMDCIGEC